MANARIAVTMEDKVSGTAIKMGNSIKSLSKDSEELNKKLEDLRKQKAKIQIDVDEAKKDLKDTKASFEDLGTAASKSEYIAANVKYDEAKSNLRKLQTEIRNTEKQMDSLSEGMNNEGKSSNYSTLSSSTGSALGDFAKSYAIDMAGEILGNVIGVYSSSAFAASTGNIVEGTLSTALSGAAVGTAIAPGVGTLAGAIIGGIAGAIKGVAENFENADDFFKSIVTDAADNVYAQLKEDVTSGSNIASTREQTALAFSSILGDESTASSFLGSLQEFSNTTPFEYDSLTNTARTLLAYGYKENEIIPSLTAIGDAGSALGMTPEDINFVAKSLGRIKITNKPNLEYLNPLLERGVDVYGALSSRYNMSKEEIATAISKNQLRGSDVSDVILDFLAKEYGGMMNVQAQTFGGLQSTINDLETNLKAASGQGYNDAMKEEYQQKIDWYDTNDEELRKIYEMLGQYQAELASAQSRFEREAFEELMHGNLIIEGENISAQYREAEAHNKTDEMTTLVAIAKNAAYTEYLSSDEYKAEMSVQERILDETRAAVRDIYADVHNMYMLQDKRSLGIASDNSGKSWTDFMGAEPSKNAGSWTRVSSGLPGSLGMGVDMNQVNKRRSATGISRVPYDGYKAILHEGEKVITASKATEYERKKGGVNIENININAGNNQITNDEEFAELLVTQLEKALAAYGG